MPKITFMGAGSTVFAKNVLGDCLLTPALESSTIALYDIDERRLSDSRLTLESINNNLGGKARIESYLGTDARRDALRGAHYVVNAIQVGLYDPCTITDFEVPKKYGLRQTIGDTNPMAMLTGYMQRYTGVKTVGLCHSVQVCVPHLFKHLDMPYDEQVQWDIAGINHQAWLLKVSRHGEDLYPEIKRRAFAVTDKHNDMVRFEIMKRFGYYITESSEHNAEYMPWFIKDKYPELIDRFNIPLDEYPRRCLRQMREWDDRRRELTQDPHLSHTRTHEYGSYIMEAMETNRPYKIGGNVLNTGLIDNLPREACVEVPCLVDSSGITPCHVGSLPPQCAALNRTNVNVQLLTIEAAVTRRKEHIYQAALLDPHCASELSIDDTIAMCDELIEAHGSWLPAYQ